MIFLVVFIEKIKTKNENNAMNKNLNDKKKAATETSQVTFGNNSAKIENYKAFWNRTSRKRPMVGFTYVGWYTTQEFIAFEQWSDDKYLKSDMINPSEFIDDHIRLLKEGFASKATPDALA